jgi:hypothetical protein
MTVKLLFVVFICYSFCDLYKLLGLFRMFAAHGSAVAGSIPDEVNEFFNLPNSFSSTKPWGLLSLQQKSVPEAEK